MPTSRRTARVARVSSVVTWRFVGSRCRQLVDPGVQHVPLLEGSAQCAVQTVLEVELAVPADDVGEQVAVERRARGGRGLEPQRVLGRDQLAEAYLTRREGGPGARRQVVRRVRPPV